MCNIVSDYMSWLNGQQQRDDGNAQHFLVIEEMIEKWDGAEIRKYNG